MAERNVLGHFCKDGIIFEKDRVIGGALLFLLGERTGFLSWGRYFSVPDTGIKVMEP